jgi:DNA-binding CsgD family transcriptional regulator
MSPAELRRLGRDLARVGARHSRRWPEAMVLELIRLIYEAAADANRWPIFLERAQDVMKGSSAALAHHDFATGQGGLMALTRLDPASLSDYHATVATHPAIPHVRQALEAGLRFGPKSIFAADREVRRSAFFGEWLQPNRILPNLSCALHFEGSLSYGFDFYRPLGADDFGTDEIGLAHVLVPHLKRALQIHGRLEGFAAVHDAALDTLERASCGIVLFGAAGSIAFANRLARAMFASRDGLSTQGRRLVAALSREDMALRAAIGGSIATSLGTGAGAGGAIAVSRPSGRRPWLVLVSPLGARHDGVLTGTDRVCAIAFVTDPEQRDTPSAARLAEAWSLTPTQARVAERLVSGDSLADVADALTMTRATARSHLKAILRRTAARTQSDLVRRLLPPQTLPDSGPVAPASPHRR